MMAKAHPNFVKHQLCVLITMTLSMIHVCKTSILYFNYRTLTGAVVVVIV